VKWDYEKKKKSLITSLPLQFAYLYDTLSFSLSSCYKLRKTKCSRKDGDTTNSCIKFKCKLSHPSEAMPPWHTSSFFSALVKAIIVSNPKEAKKGEPWLQKWCHQNQSCGCEWSWKEISESYSHRKCSANGWWDFLRNGHRTRARWYKGFVGPITSLGTC